MSVSASLHIAPFTHEQQDAVKHLILTGLVEHWGFLDASKNADLNDIAASYAESTFLVATLGERVVGTGAYVPRSSEVAEVVRMSVATDLRRFGIGRTLLHQLCERARRSGFQQLVLETTATWQDAIAFYLRFGFRVTHRRDDDIYFALDLVGEAD